MLTLTRGLDDSNTCSKMQAKSVGSSEETDNDKQADKKSEEEGEGGEGSKESYKLQFSVCGEEGLSLAPSFRISILLFHLLCIFVLSKGKPCRQHDCCVTELLQRCSAIPQLCIGLDRLFSTRLR